jgi:hypothetical protein
LQFFLGILKNGKIINRPLNRNQWLFFGVERKLFLISKYNKTIDKVLEETNINKVIVPYIQIF